MCSGIPNKVVLEKLPEKLTSVRVININVLVHNHSAATKSFQSCPTLCDPIDGSPPGSTVPGILQARTLE